METIKIGCKGEDVKKLQKLLGITADGDFGKKTDEAVKKFQKENGLTCDGIVGNKTWEKLYSKTKNEDSDIILDPINVHITKANREIKYLVIHFTAGSTSKEGTAKSTRKVFLTREASADFLVDDKDIVQVNPNLKDYYCWAVGDGKGKNGITNKNCISIEMCSSLKKGTSAAKPNHEGWYFTDEVIENTVKLSKILMEKYNIPLERVVRHYDASGKLCPGVIGWNNGTIYTTSGEATKTKSDSKKWEAFKERLK